MFAATCALAVSAGAALGQNERPAVNRDAKAIAEFQDAVKAYVEIHKKAESALPRLPEEATPQQIDKNQRELGRLITEARTTAKQGDLFTPEMEAFIRRLMAQLLANRDGAQLKASIMDENPQGLVIKVNQRYPDEVPLSTMPPQVLEALPKMPEELEYRFVGATLAILDTHAYLIVDLVPSILTSPKP
jgi:hypothetical protein